MQDARKIHKCTRLQNTSRVNEKILEYYIKFGRDRELEKFMRFSPGASQRSSRTTTGSSCTSDESGETFRRLFQTHEQQFPLGASKSLPNMDTAAETGYTSEPHHVHIIPIRLEEEAATSARPTSTSNEELQTPKKTRATKDMQVQTPDSIAKSHKRLEWDSLGDVGYKKSMSTSNISILERSLLKEFFQERLSVAPMANVSESDLKKLEKEIEKQINVSTTATPPLASSTLVERTQQTSARKTTGTLRKFATQGTSTTDSITMRNKLEKYAQTSVQRRPSVYSQEVQVNMSASGTNSALGSSTTPTSFDYYSSRSSRATSTEGGVSVAKSSGDYKISRRKTTSQHSSTSKEFVTSITDMLSKRKVLAEQNSQQCAKIEAEKLHQLHETLQRALEENKENVDKTTVARSPQLDLGIQLLCSLINAKSLSYKEKKHLVRDIVKRISRLGSDGTISTASESHTMTSSENKNSKIDSKRISSVHLQNKLQDMVVEHQAINNQRDKSKKRIAKATLNSELETNYTDSEMLIKSQAFRKPSPPTTSADALKKLATKKVLNVATNTENNKYDKTDRPLQIDIRAQADDAQNSADKQGKPKVSNVTLSSCATNNSSGSATSTTSRDLITQKEANYVANNSNTDTEQATMREWLNPMTQSEIEYEEKKRELLAKQGAKQKEKSRRKAKNAKSDTERTEQLNWIETEIERLEKLRNLLQKDESYNDTSEVPDEYQHQAAKTKDAMKVNKESAQNSTNEKLYDTVYTEKNSTERINETPTQEQNKDNQPLVQEIEVIIEESNEDVVNLDDKLKRTKERKRETQVIYDKPTNIEDDAVQKQSKARFRAMKETITINEEQVLSSAKERKDKQVPIQRSKIDTPSSNEDMNIKNGNCAVVSNDSESVCSFVQQRKREFMQHYKQLKKNHYAALVEHQKHEEHLLQQQQRELQRQRQMRLQAAGHYSLPHTMQRMNLHHCPQRQHHPLDCHYHQPYKAATTTPPPMPPAHQFPITGTSSLPTFEQQHNRNSSSSLFCMSSEVSVPMGSHASTSTATTTHQYDDVAGAPVATAQTRRQHVVGVAVQTGASLQRTRPIFGPQNNSNHTTKHWQMPATMSEQTSHVDQVAACVQVKPQAIAYVIQFEQKSEQATTASDEPLNVKMVATATTATTSTSEAAPQLTLQAYLERAKPKFCAETKQRKAILNQIQALRQERERKMREIIDNTSCSSIDKKLQRLPPPPTKQLRIFPTREMKAMTHKHCATLPEVLERQQRDHEERRRRGNRVLRDVFNRRLQRRVRNGKLSLNHSRTVI